MFGEIWTQHHKSNTIHQPNLQGKEIKMIFLRHILIASVFCCSANVFAQAWRNCIPGSMGPGGCESMGPGGGQSMGPGGGMSMGPGGGMSMGPGGGQSMGPGGGQSMGPGGGQALDRDRTKGLDTNTLRPYPCSQGGRC
jgi:hypothetical protein